MTETWIDSVTAYDQIVAVVREETPSDYFPGSVGVRYVVACTCGWQCAIATVEDDYAIDRAHEHLDVHRPLTTDEIFDRL